MIGELSLNGEILPVRGVLPMVEQSAREGMEVCLVPEDNLDEALLVRGICVIGVRHLKDAVAALFKPRERLEEEQRRYSQRSFDSEDPVNPYPDFADMIGQQPLKRCGMIAAAGISILSSAFWGSAGPVLLARTDWVMAGIFAGGFLLLQKFRWNPILVMVLAGGARVAAGAVMGEL